MPVPRPTPGCIWNSFRASGKHHLLLTGGRGSGKTTLLGFLCPEPLPGVTTWADPGKAVYLREESTGRETVIGLFDSTRPGAENKMQPVSRGLQTLGVDALRRCLQQSGSWVRVDEIGYLELTCPEYCQALRQLFEEKQVLAAVRKQDAIFLNELLHRQDVFVVDLDNPYGSTGCVMMASGLGRRFGGSKLLVPFLGKPLLSWALEATDGLFSRRVVVTRSREAAAFCAALGVETVVHDCPGRNDTVRLGLEAVGNVSHCLFCPADQPLLSRQTVESLLLCGQNSRGRIWRPSFQGTPGAPILFPRDYFEELKHLPQGKGGGVVAASHGESVRTLPVADRRELWDIDTPENLTELEQTVQ
mgnify:CR=1 FL=1